MYLNTQNFGEFLSAFTAGIFVEGHNLWGYRFTSPRLRYHDTGLFPLASARSIPLFDKKTNSIREDFEGKICPDARFAWVENKVDSADAAEWAGWAAIQLPGSLAAFAMLRFRMAKCRFRVTVLCDPLHPVRTSVTQSLRSVPIR